MSTKKRAAPAAAAEAPAAAAPVVKKSKPSPAKADGAVTTLGKRPTRAVEEASTPAAAGSTPTKSISKPRRSSRPACKDGDPNAPPKNGAVIYIGHVPHGFYEQQMRGFFSQFGVVTRVRLSRSKKTGNSKHFAFIEFKFPEVASIAAEAMNNYMMFGKILKVHVMPNKDLHPKMFLGANTVFKKVPWGKIEREKREKERTPKEEEERVQKLTKKDEARRKKIAAAGIDYEFEGYEASIPATSKHTTF